ncbi:hypothetical protein Bca52824_011249 [Brassica carinata]|uniref:Uncharacterized protein n=1 Tax=Brassica carinata TaxID=52824 RepID=A0A8X7WEZ6_BRACI|nr:hypothetical protein Bca52824_011249 [Brassica carinata]
MKDTTKNTVPKGSNNKRKRETTTDDAETTNSVPLKRVFGSVLSDVTNLHPSVGRQIILTGQLSSLRASVVSETNNVKGNSSASGKRVKTNPDFISQGSTTMRKRKPKNYEAEIIQPVFTSEASNIPLPRILSAQDNLTSTQSTLQPTSTVQGSTANLSNAATTQQGSSTLRLKSTLPRVLSAPMDLPDADGYDSEEDGDELFQFDYDGNSDQYGEQEYDCSSEESGTESDSTISTMEETVPVLSRTKEPAPRSGCFIPAL